jgi:hypothetical protein
MISRLSFLLLLFIVGCSSDKNKTTETVDENEQSIYIDKGKQISSNVFEVLSSNLSQAMAKGGVAYAIGFCNTQALKLTDSLSAFHDVSINRIAQKARNPINLATENENDIFIMYQSMIDKKKELKPILENRENEIVYYSPILLQPQCVMCHGEVDNQIGVDNYAIIKQFYPNDKATGFKAGDLRGLWKIVFKNNKS